MGLWGTEGNLRGVRHTPDGDRQSPWDASNGDGMRALGTDRWQVKRVQAGAIRR